jgi:hypothetical protein
LESVRAINALVGLTPAQTFDAIRRCVQTGGAGARICDRLIDRAAIAHDIKIIVTWNVALMRDRPGSGRRLSAENR